MMMKMVMVVMIARGGDKTAVGVTVVDAAFAVFAAVKGNGRTRSRVLRVVCEGVLFVALLVMLDCCRARV